MRTCSRPACDIETDIDIERVKLNLYLTYISINKSSYELFLAELT